MTRRSQSLLALLALVALALGGWQLWMTSRARVELPASPPEDDLEMLARVMDAGAPLPKAPDLLVAGPVELYVASGDDGVVEARSKSSGASRVVARVGSPVRGLALAGDSLYATRGRGVVRLPIGGGAPVVVTDSLSHPRAIAADGPWVFVVDVDTSTPGLLPASAVVRLPAAGGPPATLGRYRGEVTGVALDRDNAYWTDRLEGDVLVVPQTGGEPRALATDRGLPEQLVVDGDALTWVERRSESLWTLPKACAARAGTSCTPRRLAQDFAGFMHTVAFEGSIVWVNEEAVDGRFQVLSVPEAGGDERPESSPTDGIDALATDGARLFWLRDGVTAALAAAD